MRLQHIAEDERRVLTVTPALQNALNKQDPRREGAKHISAVGCLQKTWDLVDSILRRQKAAVHIVIGYATIFVVILWVLLGNSPAHSLRAPICRTGSRFPVFSESSCL